MDRPTCIGKVLVVGVGTGLGALEVLVLDLCEGNHADDLATRVTAGPSVAKTVSIRCERSG